MSAASGLDLTAPPFDLLTAAEVARLGAAADIVLFRRGETIIEAGAPSSAVYVILKGRVRATDQHAGRPQHFADYDAGELFGAFAAIVGRARHRYEALVDTLCHALPAALFLELTEANPRFRAYFHESLAVKRRLLAERDQPSDLAELLLTRIRDALVLDAVIVAPETPIATAVAAMRDGHTDAVLVADGGRLGIATRSDLLDALALRGVAATAAVGTHASFPALALDQEELVFQALVLMTGRHIQRIVVTRGERPPGTLGLMEVLSHFSGSSHVLSFRLARATSLEELSTLAGEFTALVRTLLSQGAAMRHLTTLTSALNQRLLAKVFELTVPAELREHATLLALGSEGRHEQILKTDQDNALVFDDGVDPAAFDRPAARFSEELVALGYPPCPGAIMVSNPDWRGTRSAWLDRIDGWLARPDPEAMMCAAIAFDASVVAGDRARLDPLRERLGAISTRPAALRAFAQKAVDFNTPLTLFGRLAGDERGTDLKKGGIFPLVHGLRTLALEGRIAVTNSFERVEALIAAGVLEQRSGRDLSQALAVLLRLRVGAQLAALRAGRVPDDRVDAAELRRLDRDLLRDALRVVNDFKRWLTQRYGLD